MEYLEVKLLSGNTLSIRKDLILLVMKLEFFSKEMLKEKPFLKESSPCTLIQLSIAPGELYCRDSYDSVMQQLK